MFVLPGSATRPTQARTRTGNAGARTPSVVIAALALSGAVAGAAPAAAQSAAVAEAPARADLVAGIDSIVNAALAQPGSAPGLSVAVVQGGDTLVMKGYGLADVEHQMPVTDRTVFRIGSVTKQFTAAAVMKLVEEGKISLDATIADYLPDYPEPGRNVTIHQLLNHTSGIPSYTGMGERFWDRSRLDLTHEQMLELFASDSLEFASGSQWAYNNSGYYLLGVILEKVVGKPYEEHLDSTQWDALGLDQTSYCRQREVIPHRAEGYDSEDGELIHAAPLSMNPPGAAGALCSTARDLVHWAHALASGRVVSDASFDRMTEVTRLSDGKTQNYGYGLMPGELEGHAVVQHGGGINGFAAQLTTYPDDDLMIVVLANGPTNPGRLEQAIARKVLGLAPPPQVLDLPTTAEQRAVYVGRYDLAPTMPIQISVFERDERLIAQAAGQGPLTLRYQGGHTFAGPDGVGITIEFTVEGGKATSFTLAQGGTSIVGRRVE